MNTKRHFAAMAAMLLSLSLLFSMTGCGKSKVPEGLWEDAVYTEDTELGEGGKTFSLEVAVEEKTVTFTVHTDCTTVGEALLACDLIAGDPGEYGLYIKVVNGITADYDTDQSYWAFYIDGEMAMTGVDGTEITDGAVYRLEYTK